MSTARQVANRPVYLVMAVTVDGTRDILGIWAGDGGEGAKYWPHVFTELKNRGLGDVLPGYARPSAPVDILVSAILEDEERFCAMCGCFGERDGFSEAFERERLALGDAQHFISDDRLPDLRRQADERDALTRQRVRAVCSVWAPSPYSRRPLGGRRGRIDRGRPAPGQPPASSSCCTSGRTSRIGCMRRGISRTASCGCESRHVS